MYPSDATAQDRCGDWVPLGDNLNGRVNAVAVLPNGQLVAAGSFSGSGPQWLNQIATWDGNEWLPMGGGMTLRIVLRAPEAPRQHVERTPVVAAQGFQSAAIGLIPRREYHGPVRGGEEGFALRHDQMLA
jgi:hypothetical protein